MAVFREVNPGVVETVVVNILISGVGMFMSIASPLLPQLQEITQSNVSQISWFGTLRSAMFAVGCLVSSAKLCHRLGLNRVLQGGGLLSALLTFVLPWSRHLAVLLLIGSGQGFLAGLIILTAVHQVRTFWERNNNLAVMRQLLTASYMIGSFVAPFIVVPFLPTPHTPNTTMVRYVLNASDANATVATPDPLLVPGIDPSLVTPELTTWNYMNTICTIIAAFLLVTSLAYVMMITFSKMAAKDLVPVEELMENADCKQSPCYSYSLLIIGALNNALYGGMQMSFGGMYLVEYVMSYGITQTQGAFAVTLFWGAEALGGFLALGVLKLVGTRNALFAHACVMACGVVLFASCKGDIILIQVASFVLGLGCSIFPQGTLSWLSENTFVPTIWVSILLSATPVGQMVSLALVGAFFQSTPMSLPYALCVGSGLMLILQVIGHLLTCRKKGEYTL